MVAAERLLLSFGLSPTWHLLTSLQRQPTLLPVPFYTDTGRPRRLSDSLVLPRLRPARHTPELPVLVTWPSEAGDVAIPLRPSLSGVACPLCFYFPFSP